MEKNFQAQLNILKSMGVKPNYSELARIYGKDRHTIAKYDKGYAGKSKTRSKKSKLDGIYEEIKEKLNLPGTTVSGTYQFFLENNHNIGTYSNFDKYVKKHRLKANKSIKVHLRYETDYGDQLQFDWKEDIRMVSKYGEIFEFNIFSATLGASRLHSFVYSKNKTRDDVYRCLIETFRYINGIPKTTLTDNMSSIVNVATGKWSDEFLQFSKDMGFIAKKCKIRSPETKGKDESANRFMSWLIPYNNEFEDEADLIKIVGNIRDKANNTVNQSTGVKPILLFQKEKEHLLPLPNSKIIDSYIDNLKQVTVSCESLIYYKGNKYSVSPKFVGTTLKLKEIENKLYIYYNKDLITMHDISNKKINYLKEHYEEGLKTTIKHYSDDDIKGMAEKNLELLDNLKEEVLNE